MFLQDVREEATQRQEMVNTPKLENAIEDAYRFRFDELGLSKKLAISSRTTHRETPRRNKNIGMQSLPRVELSKDDVIKLPNRNPLLIVWLSIL
jgi:hypothetical protein